MSIPATALPDATQPHPRWCDLTRCTAYDVTEVAETRVHRSPTYTVRLPAFRVALELVRHEMPGQHDTFMIATVGEAAAGDDSWWPDQAGATLSMSDAWRILDTASGLLEQVR